MRLEMKISDFIKHLEVTIATLENLKSKHGDIPIGECSGNSEWGMYFIQDDSLLNIEYINPEQYWKEHHYCLYPIKDNPKEFVELRLIHKRNETGNNVL